MILLLAGSLNVSASQTLRGRVVDRHGEGIFAANVFLKPTLRIATATGMDGEFELFIPDASLSDTLVVSFVGYCTQFIPLTELDTTLLTVVMKDDNRLLNAVLVESQPETTEEFSIEKLDRMDIYLSPVSNGDALNALTILPASTNTDESANPAFRGSSASSSQVLLNGIPIVRPVRNTEINGMGNFSLFNTSLIDNMTVYAGNPPLSKSNATAGVTDIHTARHIDFNQTECSLSLANIGVLRSQMLDKQGNSFVQVYTNWQFHEPYISINNASGQIESFRTNDVGLNLHLGKDKKAEANLYAYFIDETFKGTSYIDQTKTGTTAANRRGFAVANLKGFTGRTAYDLSLGVDISDGSYSSDTLSSNRIDGQETDHRYHLNAAIKHYFSNRLWIEGGISTDFTKVDMVCSRPVNPYDRSDFAPVLHTDTTLNKFTPEVFLYARYEITDGLVAGIGLRGDLSGITGGSLGSGFTESGNGIESGNVETGSGSVSDTTGTGSGSVSDTTGTGSGAISEITGPVTSTLSWQANLRYSNGCHSLLISGGMYHGHLPPTLYIPYFTSTKSLQAAIEYSFLTADTHIEASLYGKREIGIEYISHLCRAVKDERHIAGAEVSCGQTINHLRLGLSYTCLLSYTFIDGEQYKSYNHLPWWLKGSIQYAADDGFTIALNAQGRPGTLYTPVTEGIWDETTHQFLPVFGDYNSERLGYYCRLDLSLNKVFDIGKRSQGVIFATFSNIFNRQNEAGPIYSPTYSDKIATYNYQPYTLYFGTQVVF